MKCKRLLCAGLISMLVSFCVFGQAKKPKLMIVPAMTWCSENGYVDTFQGMSGTKKVPNYQRAFEENAEIAMIIGAMQDFMTREGYQVVDLKSQLGRLNSRSARDQVTTAGGGIASSPIDELNKIAKCDITVELHYSVKRDMGLKYLEFNCSAIDTYVSTPVSTGNIGKGTPAPSTDIVNQLEEAVLSFKDKFISDMDLYYNRLFENGRQVVIRCTKAEFCPIDFEEEYDGEELATLIENWIADNAMKGNYDLSDRTENELFFDYVNIPMTYIDPRNGNERGTDANWMAGNLRKYIESVTGQKCKTDLIGLGEINLIMGGK